jgi:hypothetical protein
LTLCAQGHALNGQWTAITDKFRESIRYNTCYSCSQCDFIQKHDQDFVTKL